MEYKNRLYISKTFIYIAMIVFALIAIVPVYVMLINATRTNAQINSGLSLLPGSAALANWEILTNRGFQIFQGFGNSAFLAISTTLIGVYFSSLTAYALHVYRFKGRNFIWGIVLLTIMIPGSLSFIGFYKFIASIKLLDSYVPLIVPAIASVGTILFLHQYFESVLPMELIEASRIDGAGELKTFHVVILPVITPALATQCIFSFVGSWNNFMGPFVLLSDIKKYTLPMLVQMLRTDIYRTEFGAIYLGIAVSLVPILIFYAFMSRYIISGIMMGSVKE